MSQLIIVRISVRNQDVNSFKNFANAMKIESLKESGCETYSVFQDYNSKTDFIIYEIYKSTRDLETHQNSNHYKAFLNNVIPILTKEPIIKQF